LDGWAEPILAVRRQALTALLDVARRAALALLEKDRYKELGEAAEAAHAALAAEADAVGMRGELDRFRDVHRFHARLAGDAGRKGK
jgi:hypothetical protein